MRYLIFDRVAQQTQDFLDKWEALKTKLDRQTFSDSDYQATFKSGLHTVDHDLKDAAERLFNELEYPLLILATTGTTSSGKSTLVNLLCGAEIVPVAVQEKSAGIVIIEYRQTTGLKIKSTPGATWECGEWQNLSDREIYDKLNQVMEGYLDCKRTGRAKVATPQSTIYYPFKLKTDSVLKDLPAGTKVQIMDLPGLAHVGDTGNLDVIKACQDALCLVTYNSAEVDTKKKNQLLSEVVKQVKELGGSPDRMLFILNRIDEFRARDKDWQATTQQFVEDTERDIKKNLEEKLPDYISEIQQVQTVRLSALPAFLAHQAQTQGNDVKEEESAAKKLDDSFRFLIPKEIKKKVSGDYEEWEQEDIDLVANAVRKEAYADKFYKALEMHIQEHFPKLIIPQIIKRFQDNGGAEMVTWATRRTQVIVNSSEEKYKEECEKIESDKANINLLIGNNEKNLQQFLQSIDTAFKDRDKNRSLDKIRIAIEGIKTTKNHPYQSIYEKLKPLHTWRDEVDEGINEVLIPVLNSLEDGVVSLDSQTLNNISSGNKFFLEARLKDLNNLDYKNKAGTTWIAKDDGDKRRLEDLNDKLNELSKVLQLVINEVVEAILRRETKRVRDSIETLFKFQLGTIQKELTESYPAYAINFPESKLINVEFQNKINFSFEGGFPIKSEDYTVSKSVKTGETKTVTETEEGVGWFDWNKPRWYTWATLGLVGDKETTRQEDVYKTEYTTLELKNADIPGLDDIYGGWINQKNKVSLDLNQQIFDWLSKQINDFNNNVDRFQSDVIDRYESELKLANEKVTLDRDNIVRVWQPLVEEAQSLSKTFDRLSYQEISKDM